jgi:hypothetical protein
MRAHTFSILTLGLILSLACGGVGSEEQEDGTDAALAPEACHGDGRCCDADDVLLMDAMGISDVAMIEAIETDTLELVVSGEDLARLRQAQVSEEVIEALVGVEPEAPAPSAAPAPPPLDVSMTYSPGDRSFVLNNHSTTKYTTLVLTANGEYVYRLKRLPVGAEDSVRLSTFISRNSGEPLKAKDGITTMYISADQGVWSKRF